jgi:hypothetical protein
MAGVGEADKWELSKNFLNGETANRKKQAFAGIAAVVPHFAAMVTQGAVEQGTLKTPEEIEMATRRLAQHSEKMLADVSVAGVTKQEEMENTLKVMAAMGGGQGGAGQIGTMLMMQQQMAGAANVSKGDAAQMMMVEQLKEMRSEMKELRDGTAQTVRENGNRQTEKGLTRTWTQSSASVDRGGTAAEMEEAVKYDVWLNDCLTDLDAMTLVDVAALYWGAAGAQADDLPGRDRKVLAARAVRTRLYQLRDLTA